MCSNCLWVTIFPWRLVFAHTRLLALVIFNARFSAPAGAFFIYGTVSVNSWPVIAGLPSSPGARSGFDLFALRASRNISAASFAARALRAWSGSSSVSSQSHLQFHSVPGWFLSQNLSFLGHTQPQNTRCASRGVALRLAIQRRLGNISARSPVVNCCHCLPGACQGGVILHGLVSVVHLQHTLAPADTIRKTHRHRAPARCRLPCQRRKLLRYWHRDQLQQLRRHTKNKIRTQASVNVISHYAI